MTLLDKNGKLFGIINVFDLFVVIMVFLILIPSIIFQYRHKQLETIFMAKQRYRHEYKTILAKAVLFKEIADRVEAGQHYTNPQGEIIWKIEEVVSRIPFVEEVERTYADKGIRLTLSRNTTYSFSSGVGFRNLGKVSDTTNEDFPIDQIQVVEIKVVILCQIQQDGIVVGMFDMAPFSLGKPLRIIAGDFEAVFTITEDIDQ